MKLIQELKQRKGQDPVWNRIIDSHAQKLQHMYVQAKEQNADQIYKIEAKVKALEDQLQDIGSKPNPTLLNRGKIVHWEKEQKRVREEITKRKQQITVLDDPLDEILPQALEYLTQFTPRKIKTKQDVERHLQFLQSNQGRAAKLDALRKHPWAKRWAQKTKNLVDLVYMNNADVEFDEVYDLAQRTDDYGLLLDHVRKFTPQQKEVLKKHYAAGDLDTRVHEYDEYRLKDFYKLVDDADALLELTKKQEYTGRNSYYHDDALTYFTENEQFDHVAKLRMTMSIDDKYHDHNNAMKLLQHYWKFTPQVQDEVAAFVKTQPLTYFTSDLQEHLEVLEEIHAFDALATYFAQEDDSKKAAEYFYKAGNLENAFEYAKWGRHPQLLPQILLDRGEIKEAAYAYEQIGEYRTAEKLMRGLQK